MSTHAQIVHLPAHTPPKAQELIVRQRSMIENLKAAADEMTQRSMRTLEITAAGAAVGFVEGRYQLEELNGVPTAAAAGIVSHAIGFYLGGDNAEHLHNMGDGALAAQGYKTGLDFGRQMLAQFQKAHPPALGGSPA
jgi:hypothetical protein